MTNIYLLMCLLILCRVLFTIWKMQEKKKTTPDRLHPGVIFMCPPGDSGGARHKGDPPGVDSPRTDESPRV